MLIYEVSGMFAHKKILKRLPNGRVFIQQIIFQQNVYEERPLNQLTEN